MGLGSVFNRWLRGAPPEPLAPRLSSADAIAIAKQAAADHWLRDSLNVATATRSKRGAVIWTVQSSGVGAQLRVIIDDASGAVLEQHAAESR